MEVTLVKNPARRKTKRRAAKKTAKRRTKASYAKAAKKAAATRKRNAAKRSAAAKKAAATRKRNARKSSKRKTARKTARKAKSTRSRASYRAAAKKAAATRKRNANKRKAAGRKAAKTRAKNSRKRRTTRRNSSARRRNPEVMRRLPVVGKSKTAKWFDGEMSNKAHGAQMWKNQKLTQKVVTSVGAFSGYGYGGTFTQMGHGMSDNALMGSVAGVATGIGGITLSSYAVNKVMGEMLLKGHEKKHHTFANFTKGWRVGGYLGVGLNTVTNLLTMHYGRSYGSIGSWSNLVNELSYNPVNTVKKMVVKASGAHKLAHLPAVAGFLNGHYPGMYNDGPSGPLQGFAFGNSLAQDTNKGAAAHPADIYSSANGYYADQNDQLGFVDVLGNERSSQDVGYVDVLGYPSGIGYPAEFAENQPLYG